MASRQGMIRTTIALGIALTLGAPLTASAQAGAEQAPPRHRAEALHRPVHRAAAAAAAVAALHPVHARGRRPGPPLGALLTGAGIWACCAAIRNSIIVASLEYQGKGTMQVGGQPCNVTKYRSSINYQTSGERIQITGTRPNGQSCSTIEVLSGAYAWNEDIAGAELIKGKGKATPMAAATRERMIRLWAGPQAALKSALAGIQDPPLFAVRPGTQVPADVATAGKTSVVWEGGKPVVSFPIPGVPGATATATLDAKFMAEKVVVKDGTNTTEFVYSDYRDWNNPLHPAEGLLLAG